MRYNPKSFLILASFLLNSHLADSQYEGTRVTDGNTETWGRGILYGTMIFV